MKLLLISLFLTIPVFGQEYWITNTLSRFHAAFKGTNEELKARDWPVVLDGYYTSVGFGEVSQHGDPWWSGNKWRVNEHYSHTGSIFDIDIATFYAVNAAQYAAHIATHNLQQDPAGGYIQGEYIEDDGDSNDDGLTDEIAEHLGLDPEGPVETAVSGDFSDSVVYNDSPHEKSWRLVMDDASGNPAFVLDSGTLATGEEYQLKHYGDLPGGLGVYLEFTDSQGNRVGDRIPAETGLGGPSGTWFANTYTEGSGPSGAIPTYNNTPDTTTSTPQNPVSDYDSDFQDWIDQANSPGNISFDAEFSRGIRAGVQASASSISGPIVDAIEDQTEAINQNSDQNAQDIVDAIEGQESDPVTATFGDVSGSNLQSSLEGLQSENDGELDGVLQGIEGDVSTSAQAFENKIVDKIDEMLAIGGQATQGSRDIMNSLSAALNSMAGNSSGKWIILPAGIFIGASPEISINFGQQPWAQIHTIGSALCSLAWVLLSILIAVKQFKWAVT